MKRHIAPRKIKNCCLTCSKPILKGHVYYTKREVYEFNYEIFGFTRLFCARCAYKESDRNKRFERFKPNCHHPIVEEIWSYIPGEAVMQPDHDECRICNKMVC